MGKGIKGIGIDGVNEGMANYELLSSKRQNMIDMIATAGSVLAESAETIEQKELAEILVGAITYVITDLYTEISELKIDSAVADRKVSFAQNFGVDK